MERLRIKNFLIIEDADFEVGRFNIIIGSQASGKSIIAKLLYFFRKILDPAYISTVTITENIDAFKKSTLDYFKTLFPDYIWCNQNFEIIYELNGSLLCLTYSEKDILQFSDGFISYYNNLKTVFLALYNSIKPTYDTYLSDIITFEEYYRSILEKSSIEKSFTIFIPAGRSFFANLQNNIFSFLVNNIEIDPLMKEFGAKYENVKKKFEKTIIDENFLQLTTEILRGQYLRDEDKDWILHNDKRKINLSNTSSGQQEALPMLLILSILAIQIKHSRIFIEEPEAHLFPVSQKRIIELLSLLYNKHNTDFVLTTHSPYILTAINNAILAHDVVEAKGKEAVKAIFDPDFTIKYEDVKAYTVENGRLISIMDDEMRLIGASVIDEVSSEFEQVFNSLLEL